MDTDLLSRQLRAAVDDVRPRPGFAEAVTGGGRRLVLRRRIAAVVAIGLVAAVAGGAALIGQRISEAPVAALPDWLNRPTGGDLAGDRAFVGAAVAAWRAALPTSPNVAQLTGRMRGEPQVYWAGNTPSGPAAIVAQRVGKNEMALGLYGQQRILTDLPPVDGPVGVAFQFGTDDRTLLAIDPGRPLLLSPGVLRDPDGRVSRNWQTLAISDGVALWHAPPDTEPSAVRVAIASMTDRVDREAPVLMLPASRYAEGFDRQSKYRVERRLGWRPPQVITLNAPTAQPVTTESGIEPHLESASMLDPFLRMGAAGSWHIATGLPDGRTASITEYQQDSAPSRVYAVLSHGGGVVDGGPVDPSAPLPVKIRLPYLQGWVVAAYGSALRYRTVADEPWTDAGRDAALLPDNATAVEVTPSGGAPTVVELNR